jgi:hypothetical protein
LQIAAFNGKSQAFAFILAALLIGCRRADGGIEGDVIGLIARGTRTDITSVLALGTRQRSPTGMAAG